MHGGIVFQYVDIRMLGRVLGEKDIKSIRDLRQFFNIAHRMGSRSRLTPLMFDGEGQCFIM